MFSLLWCFENAWSSAVTLSSSLEAVPWAMPVENEDYAIFIRGICQVDLSMVSILMINSG